MNLLKNIFLLLVFTTVLCFAGKSATLSNIQKGTTTMPMGSASVTQSITSVDLTQSFLVFTVRMNTNRPGRFQIGGHLSADDEITFDRNENTGNVPVTIEWQVFEFSSGVSVQRGTVTGLPAGGSNVTISSVTTSESFALLNMHKDGGQYGSDDGITANITSSTNLYIDREAGGANPQFVYWQVIEWSGASVQKITPTLSAGTDSLAVTLSSSVDKDKTMVVGNHRLSGNVNADDLPSTELLDNNTVTFTRTGTAQNFYFCCYVVEFTDNTDVVHGAIRMLAGETTVSTTICSVTSASSGIILPSNFSRAGNNCQNTDDHMGFAWAAFTLDDNTTITAQRQNSGFASLFPFQVLEFTAATPSGCTPPEPGASTPRTSDLCLVTLPVDLLHFGGNCKGQNSVELSWATATENNSDYFAIERSFNGIDFNEIARVNAAGNSSTEQFYTYTDDAANSELNYYRLKQVDFDGSATTYPITAVQCENEKGITIYPNPTKKGQTIFLQGVNVDSSVITIMDSRGRLIQNQPLSSNSLTISSSIENGVYILLVTDKVSGKQHTEKVTILQ